MKFRLYYEGPLRSTNGEPRGNQTNPLADHKHQIRRVFHVQLRDLWRQSRFLSDYRLHPENSVDFRPVWASGAYLDHTPEEKIALSDHLANTFTQGQYRFVPLVCPTFALFCSLDILFLRKDIPGSVIDAGDLDNRIKTLIDCLRRPKNMAELKGNEAPQEGEDPFYCLLEDDKLVSHLAVETDILLDNAEQRDGSRVRLVITVELKPYLPTYFNLGFS